MNLATEQHKSMQLRPSMEVAAQHADHVDQQGRIPKEALESLKADQLLGLLVPKQYGGPGCTFREVVNVCRELSENCAATGLIFAMHQSQAAVAIGQTGDSEWHQGLLRTMVTEQSLIASATTEGATGGAIRSSACHLDAQADGVHLHKMGSVISYALAADIYLVSARRSADAAASEQKLVALHKEQVQLDPLGRWNPMGMRGACTDRFDLHARCDMAQVYPGTFAEAMSKSMLPTSHILLGSVWFGVASAALSRARNFLRKRNRAGQPLNPISNLRLAEGEAMLQQFKGLLAANLTTFEHESHRHTAHDLMVGYNALKITASELVVRITDLALRICGIQGYMEEGEFYLSRHIRDAHSAAIMVNDDRILGSLSSVVLGVPLSRTL